jgi:hypothetical protein
MAAFPAALFAGGVIERDQIATVKSILRALLPKRVKKSAIRRQLDALPSNEREAVLNVIYDGRRPADVAGDLNASPEVVSARMVRGLRQIVGGGPATPIDHLIGTYVIHGGSTIERDSWATHLRTLGVAPLQLHILDESAHLVTRLHGRRLGRPVGA